MKLTRSIAAIAASALSLTAAAAAHATTWNLVNDFSSTTSTLANGVWSYGWETDTAGFTAFSSNSQCFSGLSCWQSPGANMIYQVPLVAKNVSGATAVCHAASCSGVSL